jgi:hypothetical protein
MNLHFEDDYKDDDFTIYFNKTTLMDYIDELQTHSMLLINQVQDSEDALEKIVVNKKHKIGQL